MTGHTPSQPARHRLRAVGRLGIAFLLTSVLPAMAQTANEAQALAERAAAHIGSVGQAQAFADFNRHDGGFVAGPLYVFCVSSEGISLAHGGNPKLIGKNLSGVRDSTGKLPTVEIIRIGLSQGQGWVDYFWPNPETGRVQRKMAYVRAIDARTVCGSSYFLPDPP